MRIYLLILVLLLASCNPLRRIQRDQHTDSTAVDRSEVRKTVTNIAKEQGTLVQTVIEYYPPAVTATDTPAHALSGSESIGPIIPTPAVRRIIRTEITAAREQAITTDSVAHNDIAVAVKSESSEKVVEKPPATVSAIKWIAVGLVALLLLFLTIKFRRFL